MEYPQKIIRSMILHTVCISALNFRLVIIIIVIVITAILFLFCHQVETSEVITSDALTGHEGSSSIFH